MSDRKVAIVILTWNGLNYTRTCLETLKRNTAHPNYEVIVVDNGSSDGTIEYLQTLPWVHLIRNPTNLGFVKGNNIGISQTDPDCDVVLLNNDIEIHQSDWLTRLQDTAYGADDVGIVGCRLVDADGSLTHAGTYILPDTYWGQQIGGSEVDINQFADDRDVEGIVFACAYIKREVLDRVGWLDEDYFSYFEDTDYCFKARSAGYRVVCCGKATLIHHERVSTKVNGVSHNQMFTASQKIFKAKWNADWRKRRYISALDWRSTINFPSGYAISSRQMLLALDGLGVQTAYRYLYGPGTGYPVIEPEETKSHALDCIRRRSTDKSRVQVVYGLGDRFKANDGAYKIGFTMLETDRIPQEWVRQANLMDEIWTPSNFNVRTFKASGVRKPIHVVPLGFDPAYFHPKLHGRRNDRFFTFLAVFEWGERKAPEILLQAFADEFSVTEDVVLIVKTLCTQPDVVREQVDALSLRPGRGRIVLSVNDCVPTYQLGSLYRSADCLVCPTRGEGWGMPILEAMACGLPVIATDWSASTDFMNPTNGYPLAVERLVPAKARCPYYQGFRWAEPSYEHLRTLLRHIYEHPDEARAKGDQAAADAAAHWTWDHTARRILERLERIGAPSSVRDRSVVDRTTAAASAA